MRAITTWVTGVDTTVRGLALEMVKVVARGAVGLEVGGRQIRDRARQNLAHHHYTGRAEAAVTVSKRKVGLRGVDVTVGIQRGVNVPEARVLARGWSSKRGMQPPVEPLAAWILRKGIDLDGRRPEDVAFLMARRIKESGFEGGKVRWLDDAMTTGGPATVAAVTGEVSRFLA